MTENGMGRACGPYEKKKNEYRILLGNPDVKRPLGQHRWDAMDVKEIGIEGIDWIRLACCCEHGTELILS